MEDREADFIALLKYRTTKEGGRSTPAASGYRPQIKFPFEEMQTSGQQTFIDKELVYPGETVKASIKIISVDLFASSLTEGMEFEFREGPIVIGTGKLLTILNPRLKKASS
jgi:translation elongation factor EF-Tu-like GTPase